MRLKRNSAIIFVTFLIGLGFGVLISRTLTQAIEQSKKGAAIAWTPKYLLSRDIACPTQEARARTYATTRLLKEQGFACTEIYYSLSNDPWTSNPDRIQFRVGCLQTQKPKTVPKGFQSSELRFKEVFEYVSADHSAWPTALSKAIAWSFEHRRYFRRPFFEVFDFTSQFSSKVRFVFPIVETSAQDDHSSPEKKK